MSLPRPKSRKVKPQFKSLRALMSALAEGQMTEAETQQALDAVQMGVGLNKRDKALGIVLEQTGENKDNPVYWEGFRQGLVEGYEGARTDLDAGVALRPIAELAAEAEAEAKRN